MPYIIKSFMATKKRLKVAWICEVHGIIVTIPKSHFNPHLPLHVKSEVGWEEFTAVI